MNQWKQDIALLREPGVFRLFAARTLNGLGLSFGPVALTFGVLEASHDNKALLSQVLAAEAIPLVIFLLLGGVIADRYPRHKVLFVSQFLAALAYVVLALLIGAKTTGLLPLGLAATLSGVASAIGWPALSGIIPQIIPEDQLQVGNAVVSFGASVARIAGVVISGLVTASVGGAWALAAGGLLFLLTAIIAVRLTPQHKHQAAPSRSQISLLAELREGWQEFIAHEWLWVVVAQWSFLILCFNGAQAVLGPIIARESLGGPRAWAIVLAGVAIGEVLGLAVAVRWRPRRPILAPVLACIGALPLPFLLLALGVSAWPVAAAGVLMGASFSVFGVLWTTTMQQRVPPEALSRVSSYDAMGSMMFGPIGLLVAGPAAQLWGAKLTMLVTAIMMCIIAAAALISRDVRTLTWDEPVAPTVETSIDA